MLTDADDRGRAVSVKPFQSRVNPWLLACFGQEIADDKQERNHRFLEEALELVQSTGCTQSEALQLVAYVYGRPAGIPNQEVGGVMVTLAALCLAQGLDMHHAGEQELNRIWTKVEKIRAKQAAKPKHSPLPEHIESNLLAAEVTRLTKELADAVKLIERFCDGRIDVSETALIYGYPKAARLQREAVNLLSTLAASEKPKEPSKV